MRRMEELDSSFDNATPSDQNYMLSIALGDGIWTTVAPWLLTAARKYGPKIARKVWDWAKGTTYGSKAVDLAS